MVDKKYNIVVDLENISIEDALAISEAATNEDRSAKNVSFRKAVEILEQCTQVEGYESIRKLPLKALRDIMTAFAEEMEKMAAVTPGPTLTSDLPS